MTAAGTTGFDAHVVGREELVSVVCREIARIADASGVRVRLVDQPGQPGFETLFGELSPRPVELPIRFGSGILGSVAFSTRTGVETETIAHVDGLVSVASAALAAITATTTARDEARRDPLTGLGNRRAFDEVLRLLAGLPATRRLSLVLVDLDDLKGANGREGHPVGDAVLCSLARALGESTRGDDAAFRIGGDEFALVVRDGIAIAREIVTRVRRRADLVTPAGVTHTFSAGIASLATSSDTTKLVQAADAALMAAKLAGKNRTVFAPADRPKGLLRALDRRS